MKGQKERAGSIRLSLASTHGLWQYVHNITQHTHTHAIQRNYKKKVSQNGIKNNVSFKMKCIVSVYVLKYVLNIIALKPNHVANFNTWFDINACYSKISYTTLGSMIAK